MTSTVSIPAATISTDVGPRSRVPRVVILHLGRTASMGAWKRLETWTALFGAAGATVDAVALLPEHRARSPRALDVVNLASGRVVPEREVWRLSTALAAVRATRPDVLVCVTARVYHPALAGAAGVTVMDFVDSLARSYADRATIDASIAKRALFRVLGASHSRFERRDLDAVRVAAGWRDAHDLGADWVPVLATSRPMVERGSETHDVLFFGNLSYPPNVDAVGRLDRLWPALERKRPGTTLLLAGARPSSAVQAIASSHPEWTLQSDFADVEDLGRRARIACVPLARASGIQIKVLEAAAMGLPQVVTPQALGGMRPGFPAVVADSDDDLVAAIAELLDGSERRRKLALSARSLVRDDYGLDRWVPWASSILSGVVTAKV